jgi:hypothetical protein
MMRLGSHRDPADQRATVHRRWCEPLTDASRPDEDDGFSSRVEDWVGAAGQALSIRDALLRVISQVGGLLMLAQATGRLDLIDVRLLERAGTTLKETEDMLQSVLTVEPRRRRFRNAIQLVGAVLAAERPLRDLATPLEMLTRAQCELQGASENCCETAASHGGGRLHL